MNPLRICKNGSWWFLLRFPEGNYVEGPPECLMRARSQIELHAVVDTITYREWTTPINGGPYAKIIPQVRKPKREKKTRNLEYLNFEA